MKWTMECTRKRSRFHQLREPPKRILRQGAIQRSRTFIRADAKAFQIKKAKQCEANVIRGPAWFSRDEITYTSQTVAAALLKPAPKPAYEKTRRATGEEINKRKTRAVPSICDLWCEAKLSR